MNILFVTFGSRGDINPFLGLGRVLKRNGHTVTIITWPLHKDIVLAEGLNFIASEGPVYEELMKIGDSLDWYHPTKGMPLIAKYIFLGGMRPVYNIIKEFNPKETLIVSHTIAFGARLAAEKFNIPFISICLQPSALWSVKSPAKMSDSFNLNALPVFLRKLFLNTVDRYYLDRLFSPELNSFRKEIGLPKVKNIFSKWSLSSECSIGLFPEWFGSATDWPKNTELVGFTIYDELVDQELSQETKDFLAKGPAPIALTYGSMMNQGNKFFSTSIAAIQKLGYRAILITQAPETLPDYPKEQFLHIPYAPFKKLLPHLAALVHHGGVGTTSQAILANIPQLIVPCAFDQPDNAERITKLNIGLSISPKKYTVNAATAAIEKLIHSQEIKNSCARYHKQIDYVAAENRACEVIEKYCN